MPINYVVQQGDCISSIAFEHGFFPDTIWNYPANAELKRKRRDPNTLVAGDVVVIPDLREKNVNKPTGEMHKFRLKNTPALCSLQIFSEDEYRANQRYELEIDDKIFTGTTDAEGVLRVPIPPNAKNGVLTIGEDKAVFNLQFGHIEPPTEIRGVQARLNNLGYDCPINGKLDEETQNALREFQFANGLKETGEIDEATRQKLDELHDNVCDIPNRDEVQKETNQNQSDDEVKILSEEEQTESEDQETTEQIQDSPEEPEDKELESNLDAEIEKELML